MDAARVEQRTDLDKLIIDIETNGTVDPEEAIRHAARPRIHTFIATSDIHLAYKLKMSRDEVIVAAGGWTDDLLGRKELDVYARTVSFHEIGPAEAERQHRAGEGLDTGDAPSVLYRWVQRFGCLVGLGRRFPIAPSN